MIAISMGSRSAVQDTVSSTLVKRGMVERRVRISFVGTVPSAAIGSDVRQVTTALGFLINHEILMHNYESLLCGNSV